MLLFKKFKISGHSMEPLFHQNDVVIGSGLPYLFKKPQINDIVFFEDTNNVIFIKQIKSINKDKYFVEGLNKKDSLDSRSFGSIKRNQILGKLLFKI